MRIRINRITICSIIFLIWIGSVAGICIENTLDCCGICYDPSSEDCINLGNEECKVVEKSIPEISNSTTKTDANVENIRDLIEERKIEVEAKGSGISNMELKIKPKIDLNIKVSIPPGTFFRANSGSSQNMISTKGLTVKLEVEPGFDIEWTQVDVPVACANMHKAVPESSDTFEVERSPNQDELEKLLPILDAENVSDSVKQAAIWIITDNADYNDLGTLVSNGSRAIKEYEASEAMRLIDKAGIDIEKKAIWVDREEIDRGNTGKPTCNECPPGYEGPNEKCECWRWVVE
jgi:hypothetical protein